MYTNEVQAYRHWYLISRQKFVTAKFTANSGAEESGVESPGSGYTILGIDGACLISPTSTSFVENARAQAQFTTTPPFRDPQQTCAWY